MLNQTVFTVGNAAMMPIYRHSDNAAGGYQQINQVTRLGVLPVCCLYCACVVCVARVLFQINQNTWLIWFVTSIEEAARLSGLLCHLDTRDWLTARKLLMLQTCRVRAHWTWTRKQLYFQVDEICSQICVGIVFKVRWSVKWTVVLLLLRSFLLLPLFLIFPCSIFW